MPPKWLLIAVGVWLTLSIALLVAAKLSLH
jgi:hypothetical protein